MRSPALTAVTRFGLGPTPGEIERVDDAQRYVARQCDDPSTALIRGLPETAALREAFVEKQRPYREAKKAVRLADEDEKDAADALRNETNRARRTLARGVELDEIAARYRQGVTTEAAFLERLVLFWSNHLAINRKGFVMRFVAGAYEREAIRPHVLGNFADMLAVAITHPAMLVYLDNAKSIGPNSRIGRRKGAGQVNENLARELLELHTLGAGGGYTQADVNAMALTLSGWSGGFTHRRRNPVFDRRRHDFGPRTILGKTYREEGEEQLFTVLDDLAVHPSTAAHLAVKFARHFAGERASPALIEALRVSFEETGGDLAAFTRTLATHEDAWSPQAAKTVPPYDFVVAGGRATGQVDLDPVFVNDGAAELGQKIWEPPSPAGWPDDDKAFLGGDTLLERVDFARRFADRNGGDGDVRVLARRLLGDDLDPFVAEAVDRAEDRRQALVLLLMSPAFQRR